MLEVLKLALDQLVLIVFLLQGEMPVPSSLNMVILQYKALGHMQVHRHSQQVAEPSISPTPFVPLVEAATISVPEFDSATSVAASSQLLLPVHAPAFSAL